MFALVTALVLVAPAAGPDPLTARWLARDGTVANAVALERDLQNAYATSKSVEAGVALAQASYWLGLVHEDAGAKDKAAAAFDRCIRVAHAQQAPGPQDPGGYYWEAVCRAKRAEHVGIFKSVSELPDLFALMDKVDALAPGYSFGGTGRYWGAVIIRTPTPLLMMKGNSLDDAHEHLDKAVKIAPSYAGTGMWRAELYIRDDEDDKARAALMKVKDAPKSSDPEIEAWNRYYRGQATKQLKALGR